MYAEFVPLSGGLSAHLPRIPGMRGATVLGSRASHECIGVLVADSNQTQSQLLSSALRRHPGIRVARCGSELSQCLQALQADQADIVLLTDVVCDQDGLVETLRGLHGSYPKLGIVLVLDSFDRTSWSGPCAPGPADCFAGTPSRFARFAVVFPWSTRGNSGPARNRRATSSMR
jgi:hypothetical protein